MRKKAEKPANTKNAPKRKLTRAERKQIEAIIRQAKGDGKPHTVQDSIPFRNVYPDGLCRLDNMTFSKTIEYEDVNYRLAGPDDQRDIFERLCDFYNGYDPSIGVQMTLCSRPETAQTDRFGMAAHGDDLDDLRGEAADILQKQYEKGSNGYVKSKYVTLTIEAENIQSARARFSRIEADTLNRFKVMGAGARVLNGKQRLELLHGLLHPEGGSFAFEWDWLPATGLSVKDFIAPSSFQFGDTRRFRIGEMYGAVSFLQILAPEIQDRILTDFMDTEGNLMVTMHIRGVNQNEAIKMVKRKITDLDAMKIQEQKKAARSGYDMDILPSDLSTYGGAAKNLLQDLQSRNERMFNMTFLILHMAPSKQKLEIAVSQSASVAQTYNCILTRLDFQQEDGLMSSLPLGLNRINIERSLTTSALAVFVPFVTQELFMGGEAMYYGLNALSNNMIMLDRKQSRCPNGLVFGTPGSGKSMSCKRESAYVMPERPDVVTLTVYYRSSMMTGIMKWFCRMSGKQKFTPKDMDNMKKTAAFRAADRNRYSWNMEYLPYEDGSGYEARFTQCGICTLMQELGLFDLVPAMCALDYAMSEAGGASHFVRKCTLAGGDEYCDCGYKTRTEG